MTAVSRQLVERGSYAAARGIAHPADASTRGICQRLHERQHGTGIGAEIRFEFEFAAREHYGDAVVADRPGEQELVTWLDGSCGDRNAGKQSANSRCRDV